MIDRFEGKYRFLSNFFVLPIAITHDGIRYPTSEHAFVAAKTLDFHERWEISKIAATSAGKAKQRGRSIVLRPDWEQVKYSVMYEIVLLKFAVNTALRGQLLDTYPDRLVEGNSWHDVTWGKCDCKRHQGQGENKLGSILDIVRQQLLR
jgi:hypothetical protein